MLLSKGMLTAVVLVAAGFCGGFFLSNGSGQVLGMKPVHKAQSKAGNIDEVAAAGILNAAAGDDDGPENTHHPKINPGAGGGGGGGEAGSAQGAVVVGGGGGGGEGGASGGGGEGSAQAAAAGGPSGEGGSPGTAAANLPAKDAASRDGASPKPEKSSDAAETSLKTALGQSPTPGATLALTGTDASSYLIGNTVDASLPDQEPHLIYYAPRGLRGEGNDRGFMVEPWTRSENSLCEPGSDGALVCHPLQVRGEGGEHAAGTRIGVVMIAGGRWVPIYKGNLMGFPDHIPYVDSDVAEPESGPASFKATIKGKEAVTPLLDHAALVGMAGHVSDQPQNVVYFAKDGRRLAMNRPEDDAETTDGVAVKIGHWTFARGLLCQSDGGIGSVQACYKPEAMGDRDIRLIPKGNGADIRLTILSESPKTRLQAAN